MENLKVENKFNLEDFKVMENIEHSYFPNDHITLAKEVLKWYEKNNLTCIGVRNCNNEVIASVNILPLKKDVFDAVYNDRMNEADILSTQIQEYKNNHSYYLYLSSISICKEYRNNYQVITTLLKGCIHLFDLLIKRNIKIEKVMADASTIHGEKICKKLLNMKFITNTSHNSKIYCVDGIEFIRVQEKLKRYIKGI